MIDPTKSNLFKLSTKKYLMILLKVPTKEYLNQNFIAKQINPYIQANPKPRLIEVPSDSIKKIQRNIKCELNKIEVPSNVFSGIKGKSYIDNATIHQNCKFLFKIDLTAFFPCITRETVYNFFKFDLRTSSDIANILTNFVTIDLTLCDIQNPESVEQFLLSKGIKTTNHLISGSPASQILSYLSNRNMFDELQTFCDKNDIIMSIYVDDITFSSQHKISHKHKEIIYNIISKHLYKLSRTKVKYYTDNYPKSVTGTIISHNGKLIIPNSLSRKIVNELRNYKRNPLDEHSQKRLQGLIIAAQQTEPAKFRNMYNYVRNATIK